MPAIQLDNGTIHSGFTRHLHHPHSVLLQHSRVAFALLGEREDHLPELFSPGVIIGVRP